MPNTEICEDVAFLRHNTAFEGLDQFADPNQLQPVAATLPPESDANTAAPAAELNTSLTTLKTPETRTYS